MIVSMKAKDALEITQSINESLDELDNNKSLRSCNIDKIGDAYVCVTDSQMTSNTIIEIVRDE